MLDVLALGFAGLLLLAAASHRFRREAGVAPRAVAPMRWLGAALLLIAYLLADASLTGEGVVRYLGAVSLAGTALVLLLSAAPHALLRPVRLFLNRR